jgi:hypothetical protein
VKSIRGRNMPELKEEKGKIIVKVNDQIVSGQTGAPVVDAKLRFYKMPSQTTTRTASQLKEPPELEATTDSNGKFEHEFDPGNYCVTCDAFLTKIQRQDNVDIEPGCAQEVKFPITVGLQVNSTVRKEDCTFNACDVVTSGTTVRFTADTHAQSRDLKPVKFTWRLPDGGSLIQSGEREVYLNTAGRVGQIAVTVEMSEVGSAKMSVSKPITALPQAVQTVGGGVGVSLRRTATTPTTDLPLWVVIRSSSDALSFDNYLKFTDMVLCGIDPNTKKPLKHSQWEQEVFGVAQAKGTPSFKTLSKRRFLPYNDADAHRLLKVATEAFVVVNCGVKPDLKGFQFTDEEASDLVARVGIDGTFDQTTLQNLWTGTAGYLETVNGLKTILYLKLIRDKLPDVRIKAALFSEDLGDGDLPEECYGILASKLTSPCLLELIWSYWHEEAMLAQTMNALSVRFQNVRGPGDRDPLAMLEIDPLRPLNNLIWGYIQDEQHRLTVRRRAYEYDHHYGISLQGKAVPMLRPADSRSKFLEAFHNLLYHCSVFFKEDDDTTVIADGFPVLIAVREVHYLLSEGAHNQFGDLPSTARQEMLLQQWILARPEFREFLPTRIMVAYTEPWMDRVDAMKKLQGWTDTSVRDFHNLAVYGERILLSIRYGAWATVDDPVQAVNWARYWRSDIQNYYLSYQTVTGVDLTAEVTEPRQAAERSVQPSVHLLRRLAMQGRDGARGAFAAPTVPIRQRPSTRSRQP